MFAILALALLLPTTKASHDDMSDDDFAAYVEQWGNAGQKYGESAAKGCLAGAIGGAPNGIPALCLGCATGAAGNVAQDMIFRNDKVDKALERK